GNGPGYINYTKAGANPIQDGAYKPSNGLIDWDYIYNVNQGIADGYSRGYDGTTIASSVNNHQWYGGVVNYEYNKIKNITINVGGDIRFYHGDHFRQLVNMLGLKGRVEEFGGNPNHTVTETFHAGPWASLFDYADEGQRVNFDYSEDINYQGGFGQIEWSNDKFSAFVQGAISNQSYQRFDRGNFAQEKSSDVINKTGYNIKGGVSWSFLDNHIVFFNAGKYSRQPFINNMFPSNDDNTQLAENGVDNEEIVGFEAGYTFELGNTLQVNLNAYYTRWSNRFIGSGGSYDPNGNEANPLYPNVSYMFTDIAQLHKGVELEARWRPLIGLEVHGYATLGN